MIGNAAAAGIGMGLLRRTLHRVDLCAGMRPDRLGILRAAVNPDGGSSLRIALLLPLPDFSFHLCPAVEAGEDAKGNQKDKQDHQSDENGF